MPECERCFGQALTLYLHETDQGTQRICEKCLKRVKDSKIRRKYLTDFERDRD